MELCGLPGGSASGCGCWPGGSLSQWAGCPEAELRCCWDGGAPFTMCFILTVSCTLRAKSAICDCFVINAFIHSRGRETVAVVVVDGLLLSLLLCQCELGWHYEWHQINKYWVTTSAWKNYLVKHNRTMCVDLM